jgi:hypothetical protein
MTSVIGDAGSQEKRRMKTAKSAAKKTAKPAKGGKGTKAPPKEAATNRKKAATPKSAKAATVRKPGVLSAAHQVLAASAEPMNCQELIAAMAEKKLWSSPNGKTPAQTLYAAIIREIAKKGEEARFAKTERGRFTATGKA